MDKTSLVNDVTPLPKGYFGSIKVVNAKSRIMGTTAILTHDLNETETIFGQSMTARYHGYRYLDVSRRKLANRCRSDVPLL